jgi:RHS repeat-associated protein
MRFWLLVWVLAVHSIAADSDKSGVKPTSISLPGGPGSVEGLGESFEPQLNSGTFVYRVPLKLPLVRGDVSPQLVLDYNSGYGNGWLGMGWRLNLPHLQRQTDRGLPSYSDSDTFVEESGEELVKLADGSYRTENETAFSRHERTPTGGWRIFLRDGTSVLLGQTAQSRLAWGTSTFAETFCWMVDSCEDPNGNRTEYRYTNYFNQLYPLEINYGLHRSESSASFQVRFEYDETRLDPLVDFRPRFRTETRLRLKGIAVFLGSRRIREWQLAYQADLSVSLLTSITMFGDERSRTDAAAEVNRDYLPPIRFRYSAVNLTNNWAVGSVHLNNAPNFFSNLAEFTDLNHDGLPDIIMEQDGALFSVINPGQGKSWPDGVAIENPPVGSGLSLARATVRLTDVRGDGRARLLVPQEEGSDGNATAFRSYDFLTPTRLAPPVDFNITGQFLLSDPKVQLVDLDMDKAMDILRIDEGAFAGVSVLLNRQGKGGSNIVLSVDSPREDISFPAGWQLADINGDRMQDLVLLNDTDNTVVCLNAGLGRFESPYILQGGPSQDLLHQGTGGHLIDLDQDGLADLVVVLNGAVLIWQNQEGRRWAGPIVIQGDEIPEFSGESTAIRFADINGNGSTDIVWTEANNPILKYLDLNPSGKGWLLSSATNALGASLSIAYRSSVDYMVKASGTTNAWTSVCPFPLPVVSQIMQGDGLGAFYTNRFSYRNAYYDGIKKEFRGFESAESLEVGDATQGAPSLISASGFATGQNLEALKGKLLWTETRTEEGSIFSRHTNFWVGRELPLPLATGEMRRVTFPFVSSNVTYVIEGGPPSQALRLEEEFDFDNFGNSTLEANYGIVQDGDRYAFNDERVTSSEYAINTNTWILSTPMRTEVKDQHGSIISRAEFYYDDETFSGNNLGFVSLGNLTMKREWAWPATNNSFINSLRNKHDTYGNTIALFDPLASGAGGAVDFGKGHAREITYDSLLHTFPITETIHLGNGKAPLFFQANYDLGLGVVTNSADFNTNITIYAFDTFARLLSLVKPGDTPTYPTMEYDYALSVPVVGGGFVNFVETRGLDKPPGTVGPKRDHYLISRQFVDGLGRKLMNKQEAEPAPGSVTPRVTVSGATEFNARQKPLRVVNPFFSLLGGTLGDQLAFENIEATGWSGQFHNEGTLVSLNLTSAHGTRTTYDATLRPIQITNPDGTHSHTIYGPLLTRSFDENDTDPASPCYNTPIVHYNDGLSRLIQVDESTRLNDDGMPTETVRAWTTRYQYDINDQLTRVTDSQNNVKTFSYDGLRRKTFMNDPDRGVMRFFYDEASNLTETLDAKGQRITYTYDGANRILTEDYHDEGLPFSANFAFDPGAPVTPANRPDVAYFYDRPVADLDQGDTTVATARNTYGALTTVWDLSGEEHTSYDPRGRGEYVVKRVPDPQFFDHFTNRAALVSYKTAFAHDSMDRLTNLTYPDADQLRYEYNDRGALKRIPGGFAAGQTQPGNIISNLFYHPSGQIAQIDYGNGVRTAYKYDSRLRLKELSTLNPQNSTELVHFAYDLDGVSNIKTINDLRPANSVAEGDPRRNTQTFQYDDLYRLTKAQYSFALPGAPVRNDGAIDYRFDRIGNMIAQSSTLNDNEHGLPVANIGQMDSGGTRGRWGRIGRTTADPPGPHALTRISQNSTNNAVARVFPYDSNGNMSDIDGLACTWDFKDRLTAAENAEMTAAYTYDYTGQRIIKQVWSKVRTNSRSTVLYLNKYYEVREHDAPTKYVWNKNTRVARVTGSLTTNIRVQRLRIRRGWNLCSLAVGGAPFPRTPIIAAAYQWNLGTQGWESVSAKESLPIGTVLWLCATTNATLNLAGTYIDPTNCIVTADRNFISGMGLEVCDLKSAISHLPSFTAWIYDAAVTNWNVRLPPSLKVQSDIGAFIAPGSVVFASAGITAPILLPEQTLRVLNYHQDHLGSTVCVTDAIGHSVEECAHYAFGHARHVIVNTGRGEDYRFNQKEQDIESGLLYLEARSCCASVGRFISVDPLVSETHSPYAYAHNNPLRFADPDGTSAQQQLNEAKTFVADNLLNAGLLHDSWALMQGNQFTVAGVGYWTVGAFGMVVGSLDAAGNFVTGGAKGIVKGAAKGLLEEGGKVLAKDFAKAATAEVKIAALAEKTAAETGGRTIKQTLPKGITDIKNSKGEVFKSVHTPPSAPHAQKEMHTHPNYRNVLPDGKVRTGVAKAAQDISRRDIIDAVREGAQRTGGH